MSSDSMPSSFCAGKIIYLTANAATAARKALEKRKNAPPRKLGQYRCPNCPGWHLGNPVRTSMKEKRTLGARFRRTHPRPDY